MVSRIAIIPARGGSKRIPNKNIADFCGKPMIEYALTEAKASGLFDKIHVSTESQKIAQVVKNLGFELDFGRPELLSDDITPIMPVLKYVVDTYAARGEFYDQVCLIMATSPLIESSDLQGAVALYEAQERGNSPVLGVVQYPVPVEWAFARSEAGYLDPLEPGKFAIRSQDLEARYYDAGSFAIYPSSFVTGSVGAGDDSKYLGYQLAKYKGVDIDDAEDLVHAEVIYRGLKSSQ